MTNEMGSTHEHPVSVTTKLRRWEQEHLSLQIHGTCQPHSFPQVRPMSLDYIELIHLVTRQRESKRLKSSCLRKHEQDTSVIKDNKLR